MILLQACAVQSSETVMALSEIPPKTTGVQEFKQGELALLDSAEDEKGKEEGEVAAFGWVGQMAVTLEETTVYQTLEEAEISEDELLFPKQDNTVVLVCNLNIRNIDASVDERYGTDSFLIDVFSLRVNANGCPLMFFSGAVDNSDPKKRLAYDLEPGDNRTFTLAYCLSQKDLEDEIYFRVGIANWPEKYKIRLELPS